MTILADKMVKSRCAGPSRRKIPPATVAVVTERLGRDAVLIAGSGATVTLACSYLVMGIDGWGCAKEDPFLKSVIDDKRKAGTIRAMGNYCEGPPEFTLIVEVDRKCAKCGAVLLKLPECPHCGSPIQEQPR